MANDRERRRARRNETAPPDFGHFLAEVPKSPHIAAYLRVFLIGVGSDAPPQNPCKCPCSPPSGLGDGPHCHAEGRGLESHQPLFRESAARGRVVASGETPEPNQTIPAYRCYSRHECALGPGTARMCGLVRNAAVQRDLWPRGREAQRDNFRNAAGHLTTGGCSVVESFVLSYPQRSGNWSVSPRYVGASVLSSRSCGMTLRLTASSARLPT